MSRAGRPGVETRSLSFLVSPLFLLFSFAGLIAAPEGGLYPSFSRMENCPDTLEERVCAVILYRKRLNEILRSNRIEAETLHEIVSLGRPFLEGPKNESPGFRKAARNLPSELFALGFPLEAAIVGDRVYEFKDESDSLRVAAFLGSAGDYLSAVRYLTKHSSSGPVEKNAVADFLILGGRFSEARDYIRKYGAPSFVNKKFGKQRDFWTNLPCSPLQISIREGILSHLSGDTADALSFLEKLEKSKEKVRGEPVRYYIRLRRAQILLETNPVEAHKIAEDITYLAQRKGWQVLEYTATLLDGWANYAMGEHYKALINFVKAGGILQKKNSQYALDFSRRVGMYASRLALRPNENRSKQIKKIFHLIKSRPNNRAVYFIQGWMPADYGPEFFKKITLANLLSRNRSSEALSLLLSFHALENETFGEGENPGALRGLFAGAQGTGEMEQLFYLQKFLGGIGNGGFVPAVTQYILNKRDPELAGSAVESFAGAQFRDDLYLFGFKVDSRPRFFLLSQKSGGNSPSGEYLIQPFDSSEAAADAVIRAKNSSSLLRIYYNADMEEIYFDSFHARNGMPQILYFGGLDTRLDGGEYLLNGKNVNGGRGCLPLSGGVDLTERDFAGSFGGGELFRDEIWFWPSSTQGNSGKSNTPVYLNRFSCGASSLRFWDMERFSDRRGPGLVILDLADYSGKLQGALIQHFMRKGTALLLLKNREAGKEIYALLQRLGGHSGEFTVGKLLDYFRKNSLNSKVIPVLPAIFSGNG